jgi:hypothetical protein
LEESTILKCNREVYESGLFTQETCGESEDEENDLVQVYRTGNHFRDMTATLEIVSDRCRGRPDLMNKFCTGFYRLVEEATTFIVDAVDIVNTCCFRLVLLLI